MKIIECPRDAMQGILPFIPTSLKVSYLNQLLKVGFDTIDFGSFVSPKAIPQLRDTVDVLSGMERENSTTKLLAIVANVRGAEAACGYQEIDFLGFPLSLSETFQQRNTNRSIAEAFDIVAEIKERCLRSGKRLVAYISMGFGNPYGDPYRPDLVVEFAERLIKIGADVISLADTIGIADEGMISDLYLSLATRFPGQEIGLHLHAIPGEAHKKVEAALLAGCSRIDGALKGYGGCPMANDELVGNIPTETILDVLHRHSLTTGVNTEALSRALSLADEVFGGR
jgi:hydroxymethylglutaryl-CoA lyase